jgi:hypothetical protein
MAHARIGQLDDRALPFISGLVNGEDPRAPRPSHTGTDRRQRRVTRLTSAVVEPAHAGSP